MIQQTLILKATQVTDNGNGTFNVTVPGRELSQLERKAIQGLFPNLSERAYELLQQETLLGCIGNPNDLPEVGDSELPPEPVKVEPRIKRRFN